MIKLVEELEEQLIAEVFRRIGEELEERGYESTSFVSGLKTKVPCGYQREESEKIFFASPFYGRDSEGKIRFYLAVGHRLSTEEKEYPHKCPPQEYLEGEFDSEWNPLSPNAEEIKRNIGL